MGMFDEITVHVPLPGVTGTGGVYQTKDMDCTLDRFEITADRRLLQHDVDQNFHGMLNFYGEGGDFLAKFTDGVMVSVERLEDK